jgi:hypothetical protein
MDDPDAADLVTLVRCAVAKGWALFMATAHLTVSIQHYSSTGVRVKFLSIQHYYFFLEYEKFQLIDYKKVVSIQLFFIFTAVSIKLEMEAHVKRFSSIRVRSYCAPQG